MNTRYENDLYESGEQEREISLSTTTILGIFFALALLCAVFFGFGYSIGRKSAQPVSGWSSEVTIRSENSSSKPAAGSPASKALAVRSGEIHLKLVTRELQNWLIPAHFSRHGSRIARFGHGDFGSGRCGARCALENGRSWLRACGQ